MKKEFHKEASTCGRMRAPAERKVCPLLQSFKMMVHVYNSRIGGGLNVIAGTVLDKIEKLIRLSSIMERQISRSIVAMSNM